MKKKSDQKIAEHVIYNIHLYAGAEQNMLL